MGVSSALRELARFIDACEAERGTVNGIEFGEHTDADDGDRLTATIEVSQSTCAESRDGKSFELDGASVTADGTLRLSFETAAPVVPRAGHDVEVDVTDAALDADGTVAVTLVASVRSDIRSGDDEKSTVGDVSSGNDASTGIDVSTNEEVPESTEVVTDESAGVVTDESAGVVTDESDEEVADGAMDSTTVDESDEVPGGRPKRGVPPFRDPDLLSEVYDSCDTFAEMTEALGMDVTAETVRRYMIDHGIHQPNSYATGGRERDAQAAGADDEGSPVVLADGIGLPDDVTVEALIETVKRSNTVYEVTRDIGMDREDALSMLRELNLLDLVVGRLAVEAEREISRDDVIDRLRETAAAR